MWVDLFFVNAPANNTWKTATQKTNLFYIHLKIQQTSIVTINLDRSIWKHRYLKLIRPLKINDNTKSIMVVTT